METRRWNKEKWWFDDSLHPFKWFETISNQKASSSLISISLHYMDPYFLKNASWDLKWVIILPSHDSTFECCQFDSNGSSYIDRHKSLKTYIHQILKALQSINQSTHNKRIDVRELLTYNTYIHKKGDRGRVTGILSLQWSLVNLLIVT